MAACADEQQSLHFRATEGGGFGPVADQEHVAFGVFPNTPTANGKLAPTAFESRQLNRAEQSIARLDFTTHRSFLAALGRAAASCRGVATARVSNIRKLSFKVPNTQLTGRAICVLDKVSDRDHDGHAALAYSADVQGLTEQQKGKVRPFIHADLADAFGPVHDTSIAAWATP